MSKTRQKFDFRMEPKVTILHPTCFYYVRHKGEMHENQRFFSTGMEFAESAYAYVLKVPSRSYLHIRFFFGSHNLREMPLNRSR